MRRTSRIPDWVVGLVLTAAVAAAVWMRPAFLDAAESRLFDLRLRWLGPAPPAHTIAIVAIDEESIARLGPWPWPRAALATLVEKLAARGAKVIGLEAVLAEPDAPRGLEALFTVEQRFRALGPVAGGPAFLRDLEALQASLDHDAAMTAALRQAGSVVLPALATLEGAGTEAAGETGAGAPDFAAASWVTDLALVTSGTAPAAPRAGQVIWPLASFGAAAAGIGHTGRLPDADGLQRWAPLLVAHGDQYLPHFALAVAARGVDAGGRLQAVFGEGMRLGRLRIPTDHRMAMLVTYYGAAGTFPHHSAGEVLADRIPASAFRGKTVLVGATAPGIAGVAATPLDPRLPLVEQQAHVIANIQAGRFLTRPAWSGVYELAATLLAGGLAVVLLPGLGAAAATLAGTGILLAGLAVPLVAFGVWGMWLGVVGPGLVAVLVCGATALGRLLAEGRGPATVKGLPTADTPVRDVAGRRETPRGTATAPGAAPVDGGTEPIPDGVAAAMSPAAAGAPAVPADGGRRFLGRYELVEEIGREGSGAVYRGLDATSRRQAVIRTVRFDDVEAVPRPEAKARLLRAAQTARGLDHPNILAVYESGEEGDAVWIAMEFAAGKSLETYCTPGSLLSWSTTLDLCARVAEALDYAHARGVIHRSLTPASITLLESGDVKVGDFGIAPPVAPADAAAAAGACAYLSPEQIAGQETDGRSDLFSLGVVLYALLAGSHPFAGDSPATVMYNITTTPPPSLMDRVPRLPPIFQKLVEKALAKDRAQRFQTGAAFASTLRALKERLDKALAQAGHSGRAAGGPAAPPAGTSGA
jgi:serine/threonine-protein kinase